MNLSMLLLAVAGTALLLLILLTIVFLRWQLVKQVHLREAYYEVPYTVAERVTVGALEVLAYLTVVAGLAGIVAWAVTR